MRPLHSLDSWSPQRGLERGAGREVLSGWGVFPQWGLFSWPQGLQNSPSSRREDLWPWPCLQTQNFPVHLWLGSPDSGPQGGHEPTVQADMSRG